MNLTPLPAFQDNYLWLLHDGPSALVVDPGDAEAGNKTELKVKTDCSYYKLTVNGTVLVEIDHVNFVEVINGTDRLAEQRKAIGL